LIGANQPVNVELGILPSQEIEEGNLVLTHKRRFRPVIAVTKSICDVYELKISSRRDCFLFSTDQEYLFFSGWGMLSDLQSPKGVCLAFADSSSKVLYPNMEYNLYGGDLGINFAPICRNLKLIKNYECYNIVVEEDYSYCCDGIILRSKK
jgi:hypothetical protein